MQLKYTENYLEKKGFNVDKRKEFVKNKATLKT